MKTTMFGRPVEILMVEDNPGDVKLTQLSLKKFRAKNHLNVVDNGEDALSFLRKQGKFANAPTPDMILLDLNLPNLDGREVLERIKGDAALRDIPVIIMTSSEAENDIARAYALHANCYITKPAQLEDFVSAVKSIDDFWFSVVQFAER